MLRLFALLLLLPLPAGAWTLTDHCELTRETPEGRVAVSRGSDGILLHLPAGLVANGDRVTVRISGSSWKELVVGGAVSLKNGAKPFREKNWLAVRADGRQVLGFSLAGSTAAWPQLKSCELGSAGGGWLTLSGEIDHSTDDRIIAAIRRRKPVGLMLNSTGGLAAEAQYIGYAVRSAGLATKVEAEGQCISECVFILAAGTPRFVEPGGYVRIHPSLITQGLGSFNGNRESVAESALYFNSMGVDGGRLAVLASATTNAAPRTFTAAELRSLHLAEPPATARGFRADSERSTDRDGEDWWWLPWLIGLMVLFPLGAVSRRLIGRRVT